MVQSVALQRATTDGRDKFTCSDVDHLEMAISVHRCALQCARGTKQCCWCWRVGSVGLQINSLVIGPTRYPTLSVATRV